MASFHWIEGGVQPAVRRVLNDLVDVFLCEREASPVVVTPVNLRRSIISMAPNDGSEVSVPLPPSVLVFLAHHHHANTQHAESTRTTHTHTHTHT